MHVYLYTALAKTVNEKKARKANLVSSDQSQEINLMVSPSGRVPDVSVRLRSQNEHMYHEDRRSQPALFKPQDQNQPALL